MKLSIVAILATVGSAAAFAPSTSTARSTQLNMDMDRRAVFGAAAAAVLAGVPAIANAGTMDQELVKDPTESWETGSPTAAAEKARVGRYTNARTQLNSNFAPIKRTTLERKSPVTRLDINAPNFDAYKKSFPGLYKKP
eukprot:CAMPEP_0204612456 /NCGR_PEP_ID=MMETSP0717-20131115/542_1 /ASSEMBLY_ACC=CAM_ASM_000666 /TAXON_ID=230516 /ORGANISM="Chaetoceros curvisetus" /LENGTH=138 /DNA_ID=CAMNT_0051624549 /DNA_START=32 /DNA_END=448 /DNA_ORIENTATION=+